MPRDTTTTGCSMCEYGRRPCVSPMACANPHVVRTDEGRLMWKVVAFVLAAIALGLLIARGVA